MRGAILGIILLLGGSVTELRAETGRLRGTLTEADGKVIPSALIVLFDSERTEAARTISGMDGRFELAAGAGEYQLEITATGFEPLRQLLRIATGASSSTFVLERGSTTARTGEIGLHPDSNLNATIVNQGFLRRMIADNQNEFSNTLAGDPLTSPRPFRLIDPAAEVVRTAEILVNGMPGRLPQKDEVHEIWINSNPFASEFSKIGIGRIEIATPFDGTKYHGSGTFTLRDEALDAMPPLSGPNTRKPPYQTRNFHGTVNGPVFHDRVLASLTAGRQSEDLEVNALRAFTPSGGLLSQQVFQTETIQDFGARVSYKASGRHSFDFNVRHGSDTIPLMGVGGLTLPERGTRSEDGNWDYEVRYTRARTPAFIHELRFQVRRDTSELLPVTDGFAINVTDNFNGGGGQSRSSTTDTSYRLENKVTWLRSNWTIKAGLENSGVSSRFVPGTNSVGTYTFSDIANYLAGTPILFSQTVYLSSATTDQNHGAFEVFLQTDWRINPRLTALMGLRYGFQTVLHDHNNLDPRVGIAYRLRPSTVIRGGAGVFHNNDVSLPVRRDGSPRQFNTTIINPAYPNPGGGLAGTGVAGTLVVWDSNLATPYLLNTAVSIEQWLNSGVVLSASYDFIRGVHLLRDRNINAPYPGTAASVAGLTSLQVDSLRPYYPTVSRITQEETVGTSSTGSLTFRVRAPDVRLWKVRLDLNGNYALGSSKDDDSTPANNYDWRAEWGRSSAFPKHSFWGGLTVQAPWNLSTSVLLYGNSGLPYNITTGTDDNLDNTSNDRQSGTPRNSGDGPSNTTVNLGVAKRIVFNRGLETTVSIYAQNVMNHTTFSNPTGVITSPLFGINNGGGTGRRIELSLRLGF